MSAEATLLHLAIGEDWEGVNAHLSGDWFPGELRRLEATLNQLSEAVSVAAHLKATT